MNGISPALATIIGALIGGVVAIVVSVINSHAQHKKFLAEMHEQNALILYRLGEVEKKVSMHNNFDSRLIALETENKALKELINARIVVLENTVKTLQELLKAS